MSGAVKDKIEREVPVPGTDGPAPNVSIVPLTSTEEMIAGVWSDILHLRQIGIDENFFDVGGDSIRATYLVREVRRITGTALPIKSFFTKPTIRGMAQELLSQRAIRKKEFKDGLALPFILKSGSARTLVVLVHALDGFVFSYRALVEELNIDATVYAFEAPGLHGETRPLSSIEKLAATYVDALKGPFAKCEQIVLCGWSMGGLIVYEMGVQLQASRRSCTVMLIDTFAARAFLPELSAASADPLQIGWTSRFIAKLRERDTTQAECAEALAEAAHKYSPPPTGQAVINIGFRDDQAGNNDHSVQWERYWSLLAANSYVSKTIKGDHRAICSKRGAREVAMVFAEALAQRNQLKDH